MIKLAPAGLKDDIEMRKVYAGFIAGQIEAGSPIIALEADLMSSMAMDSVARDYPQHVINCGIMEANVIGTAAGLALTGRKPFVHTFTAFASRRCFDQLFMALDYQRNNVKVIASDAGVTACHNGGTHMSFEDMGIVRGAGALRSTGGDGCGDVRGYFTPANGPGRFLLAAYHP
ncbi:transketolase C-terminal section [Salmonella enterica subsp. enterica]|nr:transketolase C-terminal section [Salmonella enterica subsp. enterica]